MEYHRGYIIQQFNSILLNGGTMLNFSKADILQIKEYVLINLTVISLTELFTILLAALSFYHIRGQSLDEIILSLYTNPFIITCILLSIPFINLTDWAKQLSIKFILCSISSDLVFTYVFGLINNSMVITDEVILRGALPFALIAIIGLIISLKKYNTYVFSCTLTAFLTLNRYIIFFYPDITDVTLTPNQYFFSEKSLQLLINSIFYFIYFIQSEDEPYHESID